MFIVCKPFYDKPARAHRQVGDLIEIVNQERADRWVADGLVRSVENADKPVLWPWGIFKGRYLSALPDEPGDWQRIVACLNIWNDLPDLEANMESWYPYVDHVIAVDGAYAGMPAPVPYSTDGTVEFLRTLEKVELVETTEFWPDQNVKRTTYFDRAQPGDLLWKVDADEWYENASEIRNVPDLDVGWIRYTADIYQRAQDIPNIFAFRPGLHYRQRHHYVFDANGWLVKTNQEGGRGLLHRNVDIRFHNFRGRARPKPRIMAAQRHRAEQWNMESRADKSRVASGHESLRVVQLGTIDPGLVIFRLHTAINSTTAGESIMATTRREWLEEPWQYDVVEDRELLRKALMTADIVHCHLGYHELMSLGVPKNCPVIIHHHGTMFRNNAELAQRVDDTRADLRLVSNFELLQYGRGDLHWLPNPIPVARYARLGEANRPPWEYGRLRVAHSPTKTENKATSVFLEACQTLNEWGIEVEPVLITGVPIHECLKIKSTCHVTFDSFWLGLQCSGLEAAAMGQPVIAGDETVAKEYRKRFKEVPYTFADTKDGLMAALEKLATNEAFYHAERERVGRYCVDVHDYPVVAKKYLDLLDNRFNWRQRFRLDPMAPVPKLR